MARALADAAAADEPARHRDGLVMKALALRTETVEAAALPTAGPGFGAAWLYTAASEGLVQTLTGPAAAALDDREALADGPARDRLRLRSRCCGGPAAVTVSGGRGAHRDGDGRLGVALNADPQ